MKSEKSSVDAEGAAAPLHTRRGSGMAKGRSRATVPRSTHTQQVPRSKVRCSPVWRFFIESADDKRTVICNLCHTKISRGLTSTSLTTTSMLRHMSSKHPISWAERLDPQSVSVGDTTAYCPIPRACQSPVQDTGVDASCPATVVACSQAQSATTSKSLSQRSIQLSLPHALEHKYPATHPQAQTLNGHISRLLAVEMLPFRIVDTEDFRNLMAAAVPRYSVPSHHYFSRCAIPALYQHVSHNITRALTNAVTGTVHLTTETWTSACDQARYISLTAHWVNLVEVGTDLDPGTAHVLPTPRIAGPSSIRVSATSYTNSYAPSSASSSTSELSSWSTSSLSVTSWKHYSTASVKRQQALLKLISLGDKHHTAAELLKGITDQTDLWLLPMNLQPGLVVCNNGRNLVAALKLGKLSHVPCLAHVLNLVVQRFLKTYPDLPELLVKVRHVCSYFRKSATAAASLAVLQQRLKMPAHRLVCDVTMRWNSTLHMLERLCEQQRAIVGYQLQHTRRYSGQPPHITTDEWTWISDICEVLQNFEDSTKMVSGNDAIISVTIPLLCLLKRSLLTIKEEALHGVQVEMEEESYRVDTSPPRLISSSQHGLGVNEEEEEEEHEIVACTTEGTTQTSFIPSVQRGWTEEEEEEAEMKEEEEESQTPGGDGEVLPVRSLAHMADFMSRCLSRDPSVICILADTDYWLFTLLDPRYKENFPSLIPAAERASKMVQYQQALVEQLLQKFPDDNAGGRGHGSFGIQGGEMKETHRSKRSRGTLSKVWDSFIRPSQRPDTDAQGSLTKREKFLKMVKEYLADCTSILHDSSVPYNYWVSKLDTWHELSLYALEVLACPAASVLSERVFSAAGGIITDRRMRLSAENADRLTLIKMNKAWIGPDFSTPPDDSGRT